MTERQETGLALVMIGLGAALIGLIFGTVAYSQSADLPVQPVKLGTSAPPPVQPLAPPDPAEDPRDVPAPMFYGEELAGSDRIVYVIDGSRSMLTGIAGNLGLKAYRYDPGQGTVTYAWRAGGMVFGTTPPGGSWLPASRWDRAVLELLRSVEALSESFRFNVVVFNCGSMLFRGRTVQATPPNKAALAAWIVSLHRMPTGGTATGLAVAVALGERENKQVVLLTDGEPGCLPPHIHAKPAVHRAVIRMANTQRATIDVFGITARGEWRAFCQAVAHENDGHYYDVR